MNRTATFDSAYKQLNPAQKKAVDTIDGPVMVIAGPGTGKTTILTLRIANIIRKTDTPPDAILALTFTESGASAMRRKLAEAIGTPAYKVNIHTFHGFASRIIEKYPDYFPRVIGSSIITEADQIRIIEKIIQSDKVELLRPYGDRSYYVGPILREIQILKRENVSPEKLRTGIDSRNAKGTELSHGRELSERAEIVGSEGSPSIDSHPRSQTISRASFRGHEKVAVPEAMRVSKSDKAKLEKQTEKNLELAYVYERYEKELAKNKYYDFEDMLLELIRAIETNPEFKLMLQEEYQYILADEHQDANAAQNRILELLVDFHDSPNLFIVGDDKQAIYRFQGASLENFLYFSKKYKGAVVIDLEHNYRSHQGILDASHSLIEKNPSIPGRERRKLISLKMGTGPIHVIEFATVHDELECVSALIGKRIAKGIKPEDIAILYRDNKHAGPISAALKAHGIEHRIESERDILNEPDVVKITLLCRAINDPSDSEALARALFLRELGCDSAEVADVCKEASRNRQPLHSIIKDNKAHKILALAYKRISEWKSGSQVLQFPDFLQKLIQETNMVAAIVSSPNSLERLNTLQSFYDHVVSAARSKKTFYLADFMEYIDTLRNHGISSARDSNEHIGGVRLMTAHRAKGLEFSHVFIVHAMDGIWGNRSSRNLFNIPAIEHARNTGRIEDERRLFYVAMTRARELVSITYSRADAEKERIPSQFIGEIDRALIDFDLMDIDSRPVHTMKVFQPPAKVMGVSILAPDFVRGKFLAQPLSVTHLNNYLECPWRYFFVNLIRVPQAETKHQMYGTAIHAALKRFFDAYHEERDMSKKQLVELFKHHLDMQAMSHDDRAGSFTKGKSALEGYWKEYQGKWNRKLITEYSLRGVEFVVGAKDEAGAGIVKLQLTGKIDKIELLDDQNVVVVDYKTAKPKSRNDIEGKTKYSKGSGQGNYKRQLVFYKFLLDGDRATATSGQSRNPPKKQAFSMKYGEIDFIEPNERGKYKKERFEVLEKEIAELKSSIALMANDIIDLSFVNKKCDDKECEYCKLGRILVGK